MLGRTRRGVVGGAVDHGEMGHSDAIVMHAQVALNHAKMAQKDRMTPHLHEGVLELKESIAHGNQGTQVW